MRSTAGLSRRRAISGPASSWLGGAVEGLVDTAFETAVTTGEAVWNRGHALTPLSSLPQQGGSDTRLLARYGPLNVFLSVTCVTFTIRSVRCPLGYRAVKELCVYAGGPVCAKGSGSFLVLSHNSVMDKLALINN